jgi:hypothetical protein
MFLLTLPTIILSITAPNFVFKILKAFLLGDMDSSHHPSQTLTTYQLSGLREMVGVDGETDMSEDQEAEQSADLEVVIGKEEIVVGDEEVAGQGK